MRLPRAAKVRIGLIWVLAGLSVAGSLLAQWYSQSTWWDLNEFWQSQTSVGPTVAQQADAARLSTYAQVAGSLHQPLIFAAVIAMCSALALHAWAFHRARPVTSTAAME